MDFQRSFGEFKRNKLLWIHYAIDAVGITFIFKWLMDMGYISAATSLWMYGLAFFGVYVLVDRTSHAILGFN